MNQINCTWSGLTCDGKLLQSWSRSCPIKPGLVNPPVGSLPEQNPAMEGSSQCNQMVSVLSLCICSSVIPFQDQVEPVSENCHPDEPEPRVLPQVEPDWEKEEECGVQIGHRGCYTKHILVAAVFGLQVHGQLDPPAVEKIHDIAGSGQGCCTTCGVFCLCPLCPATLWASLDFTQGYTICLPLGQCHQVP